MRKNRPGYETALWAEDANSNMIMRSTAVALNHHACVVQDLNLEAKVPSVLGILEIILG